MGQITIRLTDELEIKLKQEAQLRSKSLAEYCREKLTIEEEKQEPAVERVRLEYRMDKLEESQEKLNKIQSRFMNHYMRGQMLHDRLIYHLMERATNTEEAQEMWELSEKEVEEELIKRKEGGR